MKREGTVLFWFRARLDEDRRLVGASSVDRPSQPDHRLAEQLARARVDDSSGDGCRRPVAIRERVGVGLVQPGDPLLARPGIGVIWWHTARSGGSIVHENQSTDWREPGRNCSLATQLAAPASVVLLVAVLHDVEQLLTVGEAVQLFCDEAIRSSRSVLRDACHLRPDQDPRREEERMSGRERLGIGYVEYRGDTATFERFDQCAGIDDFAPRGVD